jgi:TPR repeat protein
MGVPINFTVAAEFLKKAADLDDGYCANSFGCCLECDEGVDEDMPLAVK